MIMTLPASALLVVHRADFRYNLTSTSSGWDKSKVNQRLTWESYWKRFVPVLAEDVQAFDVRHYPGFLCGK